MAVPRRIPFGGFGHLEEEGAGSAVSRWPDKAKGGAGLASM